MKNKTRVFVKWLIKAFVAGIVALAFLSGIAYLYFYTGIHITNKTNATDYTWTPSQRINNMKEGFSFIKMDKNGFNNANGYDENIDILLMGSSHMEAYQVGKDQNCGYLLNEMMPEYNTYNIGTSGHTIYRLADNIGAALQEYNPSKYVLIETSTVQLDVNAMDNVVSKKAVPIESYDSGILYYLQKVPAFKPIYNQLENWINAKPTHLRDNPSDETFITDEYRFALSEFLGLIKNEAEKNNVIPVIFYAPSGHLSENGILIQDTNDKYLENFKETCISLGIIFVDMSESFNRLYTENDVLPHGFSNTAVGVGHLNKYGHKAVAKKIAAEIYKAEGR